MKKNSILVAGGAGFLGSHLIDRLIRSDKKILCVDNLKTGDEKNIAHLIEDDRFKFVFHDIGEPLPSSGPDQIYNLACPASPVHYQVDAISTIKSSVIGAINLLELAKKSGAKILQASTSEVYGDPLEHPQAEEYWGNVNPVGPRACYDEGKRCAETLFVEYHRQYGLDIRISRIFNTYGPRMSPSDGRVVSNFITQALRGDPITIFGDGKQTRSFCYVDDLVSGLIAMMEQDIDLGPINLGNPTEISILELAETILKLTNSKSVIVLKPLPENDPARRKPSIEKAKDVLHWEPSVSLDDGLAETIKYFKKRLSF
ncbi:MAG: UDP-glucuronic acid decarboxylase family protein [Pseudomonadota bacterium]|nr:UDP-glucuronic acid decarboxylase family protein [Pseudomonadota bacterium]